MLQVREKTGMEEVKEKKRNDERERVLERKRKVGHEARRRREEEME